MHKLTGLVKRGWWGSGESAPRKCHPEPVRTRVWVLFPRPSCLRRSLSWRPSSPSSVSFLGKQESLGQLPFGGENQESFKFFISRINRFPKDGIVTIQFLCSFNIFFIGRQDFKTDNWTMNSFIQWKYEVIKNQNTLSS